MNNADALRSKLTKSLALAVRSDIEGEGRAAWTTVGRLARKVGLSMELCYASLKNEQRKAGFAFEAAWNILVDGWYDQDEEMAAA